MLVQHEPCFPVILLMRTTRKESRVYRERKGKEERGREEEKWRGKEGARRRGERDKARKE